MQLNFLKNLFIENANRLAEHPENGILGACLTTVLGFINVPYEESVWHLLALIVRDLGMIFGGVLSIATFFFYIYKKFKRE